MPAPALDLTTSLRGDSHAPPHPTHWFTDPQTPTKQAPAEWHTHKGVRGAGSNPHRPLHCRGQPNTPLHVYVDMTTSSLRWSLTW